MWVFLSARLRQWVLFAVAIPLLLWLVRTVRTHLEKKSGPTKLTRALGRVESLGRKARS